MIYSYEKLSTPITLQTQIKSSSIGAGLQSVSLDDQTTFCDFTTELSESDHAILTALVEAHVSSPVIPDVTPRQIRQALILSNVALSYIDNALDSLPEPTRSLAKTEWEYSLAFERNRPLVNNVAALMGWSQTDLDNLWILAKSL
jgi:hypothetical protein